MIKFNIREWGVDKRESILVDPDGQLIDCELHKASSSKWAIYLIDAPTKHHWINGTLCKTIKEASNVLNDAGFRSLCDY